MQEWSEDVISVESAVTLDGLLHERLHRTPDALAYRQFERAEQAWRDTTWRDLAALIGRWQAALSREGLGHGDRVAILLRNCTDWIVFDQAALGLGLVVVPLYTDDRPDNAAYIIGDAAAKLLLIQDSSQWQRLQSARDPLASLQRILVLEEKAPISDADARVVRVVDWLPDADAPLQKRRGDGNQLASIVYTSGTTGRPKGVMLSHRNMLSVAHASIALEAVYREDLFLSFLPLSHTLERTAGYYMPMMAGSSVAFARSIQQLAEDLQTIRPTVLISVPRIYERVYARIETQLAKQSVLARALFHTAVRVGWRRFQVAQGRARRSLALLLWPLLRRLVADKVLSRFGGRLRVAVSGGAALPPAVAHTFIGLGVPLLQGYGLTETAPVISANKLDDNDPISVGLPLRGMEVRIGEDAEILARSPGLMLGYWNNHAATTQVIDKQGWFHTGDQGHIDERGHLFITGRLKDVLVLSNGEKVSPGDMEAAIALDPLFEQVMVLGEGRAYLSALAVLNGELWVTLARAAGSDPFDHASLRNPRVHSQITARIGHCLRDFPGYAKVRRVAPMLEPWTIESGLVTPTLKVKRAKVMERFRAEIEAMYAERA